MSHSVQKKGRIRSISRTIALGIVVIVVIIILVGAVYISVKQTTSTMVSTTTSTSIGSSSTTMSSTLSAVSSSQSISSTSTSETMTTQSTSSSSSTISTQSSGTTSSSSSSSLASSYRQNLVIDEWLWPADDLNQLYSVDLLPWPNWLTYTVYQSLVTVNESAEYHDGVIQYLPGLAENWTVSANGTVYTFNLRQNVSFSNGDPFNAYQVWMEMYGFYYLSGNSSTWLESYSFFNMNLSNFGPETIALINSSGGLTNPSGQALALMENSSWPIYTNGPYQLVFHLMNPFQWFPGTLIVYDGLIFDCQYVLDNGGFGTSTNINSNFNQSPIPGTGPYVVTGVSEDSYVEFAQNPTYWGRNLTASQLSMQPLFDPGYAKTVTIYYKPDDLSRYTDLSTGASQISAITTEDWNLVQANPNKYGYAILPSWGNLVTALAMNTNLYPTDITNVRQAISHAINYSDIDSTVFFGEISPLVGPEYPAWKNFYDLGNFTPYSYNMTLAQRELASANLQNLSSTTLQYTTVADCDFCVSIGEIIQQDLAPLGINVNIQVSESTPYFSEYGSYETNVQDASQIGQLSLLGGEDWAPNALTPADNWVSMVSNESVYGNWAGYYNPTVQQCVNAFTQTSNSTYIQGLCEKAQAQIYSDTPYAWFGVNELTDLSGSIVWNKNIVSSFYTDPVFTAQTTAPIFNTVTFVS